jgi:esterase/lipase superfamily enzyme
MHFEHHGWHSPRVGKWMGIRVYGHYGAPILVFPTSGGDENEYEGQGMIAALAHHIDSGRVKLFCVNSVNNESWYNKQAHPRHRSYMQAMYDAYVADEVVPFIYDQCRTPGIGITTTGASFGAYHAANFFFRHPDVFDTVIALSGLYQLSYFIGDYMDENVYFNTPLAYLPNMNDPWYLDQYRQSRIIVAVGQGAFEGEMLADTQALKTILEEKNIPAWIDIWGGDVNHDWPWWYRMLPYFLNSLNLPAYIPS